MARVLRQRLCAQQRWWALRAARREDNRSPLDAAPSGGQAAGPQRRGVAASARHVAKAARTFVVAALAAAAPAAVAAEATKGGRAAGAAARPRVAWPRERHGFVDALSTLTWAAFCAAGLRLESAVHYLPVRAPIATLLCLELTRAPAQHPDKRATGGEDASFVGADGLSVGVADGVGGWAEQGVDAGIYARMLMSNAQANAEATTAAQSAALETEAPEAPATPGRDEPAEGKLSRADVLAPLKVLVSAHAATPVQGSSTALVLLLRKATLHGANLGDSGFMILRAGRILFKSQPQQHAFNFPYQIGSGQSDPPTAAQLYALPVQPGDIIVCGTDGLWDNLHDAEVSAIVRSELQAGRGAAGAAKKIAEAAHIRGADPRADTPFARGALAARVPFRGGKMDDCTVVVSIVQEEAAAAAGQ